MSERIDPDRIDKDGRYWAADVARILFGRTVKWFRLHRARLERDENFPQPISKIGRPRWSGETLLAWQNRSPETGNPRPAVSNSGPADVDNLVPWDRVLRQRARKLHPSRRARSESV